MRLYCSKIEDTVEVDVERVKELAFIYSSLFMH